MIIDEKKVNLAEKDIEQWLFENPQAVPVEWGTVDRWLKRQYKVPSGVIDLVGVTDEHQIVVAEVKNTAIDAAALTQVSRYAADIDSIYEYAYLPHMYRSRVTMDYPKAIKVVIGRTIDKKTLTEADALGVIVICFQVELSLSTSRPEWRAEHREGLRQAHKELSEDVAWETVAIGATALLEVVQQQIKDHKSQRDSQRDEIGEFVDDLLGREE